MNKKLLLAGAVAVAGFFTLTAFDGKTLAQQKEEIASAVTAKLEMLRNEKTAECDARVQAETATRVEAWKAEMAAAPVPAKGRVKKGSTKGPKVDPLPAGTKPTNGGVDRPGATKKDGPAVPVERPGASKKDAAPAPVERPGAKKKEGSGGN